uniref:Cyclic nucleotide-binding domain-containing protein n=1 Tax=Trichogramma kaykai TaxID=54128 RepID=A0ABD2XE96_9HYME
MMLEQLENSVQARRRREENSSGRTVTWSDSKLLEVDRADNEEAQAGGLAPPSSAHHHSGGLGSRMGPGPDSGSSAPSSVPHSLATSRDEEDDDDEESSGRRSNGHGGSRSARAAARQRRNLRRLHKSLSAGGSAGYGRPGGSNSRSFGGYSDGGGSFDGFVNAPTTPLTTTSNSLDGDSEIPAAGAIGSHGTRGSQKWSNVRAVMALYSSLRKIKRTKSNQRWMKLRTTVQLSSAVSAIQKKPPLKREDSFLKRFSTRQIPESQETIDTGEGEGDQSDEKFQTRRRRRQRKLQKAPKTVVNPDENFYYYWLMLLSGCVLYNLWTLIVRQSMPELQELFPEVWMGFDGFTDLIFFLDVGVQFRTGYLEQGLMVYNSKKLAGHYFRSKCFILDLLALMPLDLLQFNIGVNPLLRFPRFLKIYRVYNYYYMVESRTVYPNLWRVFNLIHILLILAHWFGCFYYLLSEAEGFHGDWVYPYRPGEYATLTRKYLGSLYWSTLTLTTIGDLPTPETNAEAVAGGNHRSLARRGRLSRLLQFKHNGGYIFTIVSYLIGVFIFATIVGQVGNVITNRNANRLEFERLLDGAKTYMRHHKVPGGMKRRVLRWYDYSWSRGRIQGGGDINTALGLLPDKLKTELALHVNLSVLKKVTIFQECQPEFLHDLVLKMKAYIFTPGDSICRKGEVAREMFIIADGILEVVGETGRVLTTMKAGDFFGEIGILNLDGLNKRTADVRSVGYSELFSLSREDVLAALKDYPEAQEILQKLGEKRLREAQRVARAYRNPPSPGGHDSSDNSTGKRVGEKLRIVDKLRSDAKGLKNVLRKSRRSGRPNDDGLELQPLTARAPQLRRQTRIDESHVDSFASSAPEPPISPLGAGLPLISRLRLLKEKQEREERRNLMDQAGAGHQTTEMTQTSTELVSTSSSTTGVGAGASMIQRLLHKKPKPEPDAVAIESAVVKEPLLPPCSSVIPEESEIFASCDQTDDATSAEATMMGSSLALHRSPLAASSMDGEAGTSRKWAMLKDASIKGPSSSATARVSETITTTTTTAAGAGASTSRYHSRDSVQARRGAAKKGSSSGGSSQQGLIHIRQQTKMYASVDDLSPEYGGLPFVKKLKILNERQKLAELERAVRSSSLDCGESVEFDSNLTRSHSEACAIEYARRLAKLNKFLEDTCARQASRLWVKDISPTNSSAAFHKNRLIFDTTMVPDMLIERQRRTCQSPDQLSPENETLERRKLKSILKKLSAGSRADSSEVSSMTSTPDREAATAELKKLMRAPTLEGYAARHSKLAKSVTFNKYTLQSPPGSEQLHQQFQQQLQQQLLQHQQSIKQRQYSAASGGSSSSSGSLSLQEGPSVGSPKATTAIPADGADQLEAQQQQTLPYSKVSFRPLAIGAPSSTSLVSAQYQQPKTREDECMNDLVAAVRNVLQTRMESEEYKYERQFSSLQSEIRKRDEIILQLQARILQLENQESGNEDDEESFGDSTVQDGSMEEELAEDNEDHPFMRDGSVDTVLQAAGAARPRRRRRSSDTTGLGASALARRPARRSWDEHSEEETLELQDLPRSITPQAVWAGSSGDVVIDLESSDEVAVVAGTSGMQSVQQQQQQQQQQQAADSTDDEESSEVIDVAEIIDEHGHNNWEVAMLAQELERRRRSSETSSTSPPGS